LTVGSATALRVGDNLPLEVWFELQRRAIFDYCKWDIQCEDHSVLAPFPLILESETADFLNRAAEALAREALAAEAELLHRPDLLDRLELPLSLRKVLREAGGAPLWPELRVMRFDFHFTTQGWRISEVNADVPGGFIEAGGWNTLFAKTSTAACVPAHTSEIYSSALRDAVGPEGLVALVHATAYSDDRQVMQYLAASFESAGLRTCLVSPAHLRWGNGRAEISDGRDTYEVDAVVRFFPAEWLPNLRSQNSWQPYFRTTQIPLSNPGTAIVIQTKRFPLVWNQLGADLSTWRKFLPATGEVSGDACFEESIVLKPALGRVGEGIGIRGVTEEKEFSRIVQEAKRNSHQWVAQKRFTIVPLDCEARRKFCCIGVFTIGGKAAGFYGRVSDSPIIGQNAQDAAVLVESEKEERAT